MKRNISSWFTIEVDDKVFQDALHAIRINVRETAQYFRQEVPTDLRRAVIEYIAPRARGQGGWRGLAPYTQRERFSYGFSPNLPILVRSGKFLTTLVGKSSEVTALKAMARMKTSTARELEATRAHGLRSGRALTQLPTRRVVYREFWTPSGEHVETVRYTDKDKTSVEILFGTSDPRYRRLTQGGYRAQRENLPLRLQRRRRNQRRPGTVFARPVVPQDPNALRFIKTDGIGKELFRNIANSGKTP